MYVGVDIERSRDFGEKISKIIYKIKKDDFVDNRYYPSPSDTRENIARYFLVMVALDHRLSRPGRPYEGLVDGEFYHGADLLYRLGKKIYDEDPSFFEPDGLARVTKEDILRLFSTKRADGKSVYPPDPEVRAALLRDLGVKLKALYNGSAYRIVVESRGFLRHGVGEGFIDRLKVFAAYQDPVEKKPFLLAKFLERRGVLPVYDGFNKEVPVDNHLARIAVRIGIVVVSRDLLEKIASGIGFSPEEDIILRYNVRLAYKIASQAGGIDPFIMDDFLWMFGRKCCTRDSPTCSVGCRRECEEVNGCLEGRCVLDGVCLASDNPLLRVPEHKFIDTWWY